ncbi:hypothetical protein [Photobacterium phosphoreum]|uniref:hypothetical protein n=1 Tax=Photobacterium phosphoreum TaxID=659 RepID=UPI000D155415|nr:hypothetical protein [Photobacterium phosphoreum]PTB31093.1 hypothetical protein DAT36_18750 [Photobacterium phosphoreum]
MNYEEIKILFNQWKDNPQSLETEISIYQQTINEVIRAEKTCLYGLEHTTDSARQELIEKIIVKAIEKNNNEN